MEITFQQCKDEVALKKSGSSEFNWEQLQAVYEGVSVHIGEGWLLDTLAICYKEAAKLYAQSAIQADRKELAEDYGLPSILDLPLPELK